LNPAFLCSKYCVIIDLGSIFFEGIVSIYEDAKNNAPDEELKLFQILLKKIPSWNEHLIERETNRIVKVSLKGDIIEDLIKAVIKSNIMILTNTPPEKKENMRIKHDISTSKFIHNSYIEIARNIFQNPYLFYHKYNSFELKKNQREANDIIKKSIEQSIRKLLPMNIILQNYLGSTFDNQSDDFQNPIPDSDYNNLKHMLNKDPINNEVYQLVKDKKSLTSSTSNVKINNEIVNVQLAKTNNKKVDNISSENFKTLKELANSNLLSVDDKANKILLEKTEQAIIESTKQLDLNKSDSNKSDIKKQLKIDTNKSDTKNLYNKENYDFIISISSQKKITRYNICYHISLGISIIVTAIIIFKIK